MRCGTLAGAAETLRSQSDERDATSAFRTRRSARREPKLGRAREPASRVPRERHGTLAKPRAGGGRR